MCACAVLALLACKKESPQATVQMKCYNPMANYSLKSSCSPGELKSNPALTGDTTETIMTSLKFAIVDVWVSQDIVKAGEKDNLTWVKLTKETNGERKLFEDYVFPEVEIPAGTYNSIKIIFKNTFYRHVKLVSDPTVFYELFETMGSSKAPCSTDDESYAKTNYFSIGGLYYVDDNDTFYMQNENEKVAGFTVNSDKKATITWRLGAGSTGTCKNYLIDENKNRVFDCGIDKIKIECDSTVSEYMWDFLVTYN